MTDKWIEVHVDSTPQILEEISSYLFALGADGLQENDQEFIVYFPEDVWSPESMHMLQAIVQTRQPKAVVHLDEVERQNWNERWKENFKPLQLTPHCVIVPDWETDYDSGPARKIVISPKMAFGTGHHETTQLILQLLESHLTPGDTVLDAGTGSAILAIYAAQLGAKQVLAFDNDPVAMENAVENVLLNGVQDQVQTSTAILADLKQADYDLILANINRNVLLQLAPDFGCFAHQGSRLILSGLLETDFTEISSAYKNQGWELKAQEQKGEWIALVMTRREAVQ